MTLKELIELKRQISTHKKVLKAKDLEVENILESIEVLLDLKPDTNLIKLWYQCSKEEIDLFQKNIKEEYRLKNVTEM